MPADRIAELSASAWGLAALGVAVESGLIAQLGELRDVSALAGQVDLPVPVARGILDLLVSLDLVRRVDGRYVAGPGLAAPDDDVLRADLRSTLLQTGAFFDAALGGRPRFDGWRHTDEALLQAQGTLSAGAVELLERFLFPSVPGVLERLASKSAAFLDVGAGVAAVSIEMCRRFPRVRAVALEPLDAAFRLARQNVAAAGLDARIELRPQRVEALGDADAFDVAWLPGNFLVAAVYEEALVAVHRALRPGGLVLMATLTGAGDDVASAAARLRVSLWGGEPLEPDRITEMLGRTGYGDVRVLDRTPSGLTPIHAIRA